MPTRTTSQCCGEWRALTSHWSSASTARRGGPVTLSESRGRLCRYSGGDLFPQGVAPRVSSAQTAFTTVFGMGTGGTPSLGHQKAVAPPTAGKRRICSSRSGTEARPTVTRDMNDPGYRACRGEKRASLATRRLRPRAFGPLTNGTNREMCACTGFLRDTPLLLETLFRVLLPGL